MSATLTTTTVSTLSTVTRHAWTPAQIAFLEAAAWDTTADFIDAFRDRFGWHVEHLTDNAIRNKRQHLRRPELDAARAERRKIARQLMTELDAAVVVSTMGV